MGQAARAICDVPARGAPSSQAVTAGNDQPEPDAQQLEYENAILDLRMQHAAALEAQREEAEIELRTERQQNRKLISELSERFSAALEASLGRGVQSMMMGHEQPLEAVPGAVAGDAPGLEAELAKLSADLRADQEQRRTVVSDVLARLDSTRFYQSELVRYRQLHSHVTLKRNMNIHAGLAVKDSLDYLQAQRPHAADHQYRTETELERSCEQYRAGVMDVSPGPDLAARIAHTDKEKQSLLRELRRAKEKLDGAAANATGALEDNRVLCEKLEESQRHSSKLRPPGQQW